MLIVWGTKVKQTKSGALAMDCEACGERVVADEIIVSTASHIYYIAGPYKEADRFVRCRLCSISNRVPDEAQAAGDIPEGLYEPDEDIVLATNSSLLESSRTPAEPLRIQAALFSAILHAKERVAVNGSAGGYSGLLLLVLLFPNIWILMSTGSLAYVVVPGLLSLFGVYRFNTWYLHRDIAKEMKPYVQNVMDHCKVSIDTLIENASTLDPTFRPAASHLRRCREDYM